jgi:hypothetical protein
MSSTHATEAPERTNAEEEIAYLRELVESSNAAYQTLRSACEGILQARDVAAVVGGRIPVGQVFNSLETAMTAAEIVSCIGPDERGKATPAPYCTVCNTLWTAEDERYGKCLTCERSGLTT